ncbi:MAG TPA: hypothetical protein VK599_16425 [Streptosporangiaceae bacterium]|nr:hypothetical protein [Streptosporangiaceae bacterium]
MTGLDDGTRAREAPRELLSLACATRPDWTREETWNAIHAARTAGLEWDRLALRLMAIAFREETPPTSPRELWDAVRGLRDLPGTGAPPGAGYLAVKAAKGWGTGGQPALTEGNENRQETS